MQVIQNDASTTKVYLPFPEPDYIDLYAETFVFEIIFNAKTACIGLINSKLDTPLATANRNFLQKAKQICEQELEKLQLTQLLKTKIRKYLLSFKDGFPSLTDVSHYFNMPSRNLHCQLQKEGTSFSTILMSVRKLVAIELLNNSAMTVQAIALTLGYSDIANFRKAFKQWTGVAPSDFRTKNKPSL